VIVLALYALAIWMLAVYYRRQWQGFVIVLGAAVLLALLATPATSEHALVRMLPAGLRSGWAHMYWLLMPEAGLIAVIGLYICCLPRPRVTGNCRACGYDLAGLEPRGLLCPECGEQWKGLGSGLEEPPVTLTPIPRDPPKRRRVNL
jgi:hypothetical protein